MSNSTHQEFEPPVALATRYRQRRLLLLCTLLAVTVLPIVALGAWSLWPLLMIPAVLAAPLAGGAGLVGTLLAVAVALAAASAGDVSAGEITAGFVSVVVLAGLGAAYSGMAEAMGFGRRDEPVDIRAATVGAPSGLAPVDVFEMVAERDCRRAAEQGMPVAVAVVTIPSLRRVVVDHGRGAGLALLDAAHHGVARVISPSDLVADMGDGRFVALVAGDASRAREAADRIAVAIEAVHVRGADGARITPGAAGIGAAQWQEGDRDVHAVLSRAEAAVEPDPRARPVSGDQATGEFRSVAVADAA